ncbi:EXS family-domain-containing protein, partial [Melampsora americana]
SNSNSILYLQSDSFSLIFPLPFRILFLIFLGLLLYALVLHSLDYYFNIQSDLLFQSDSITPITSTEDDFNLPLSFNHQATSNHQFPRPFHLNSQSSSPERIRRSNLQQTLLSNRSNLTSSTHTTSTKAYLPIYYSALSIGLLTLIGLVLFRFLTHNNHPESVSNLSSLSLIWLILVIGLSISSSNSNLVLNCLPFQSKFKLQRHQFRQSIFRILFGTLNDPPVFSDILLADVLTSYARVLGDLWISICLSTVAKHGLATQSDEIGCYKNLMVPLITSLPYAFRLRQCLAEYHSRTSPNPRRSLLNALKYATAFPMIGLSVFIVNSSVLDDSPELEKETNIKPSMIAIPATYQFWILSILINSLYSFWWDVTNDWSFGLFKPTAWISPSPKLSINGSRSPPPPMINNTPILIYIILIGLNLILRFSWTIKLMKGFNPSSDLMGFGLEIMEIFRRSSWCFLRLENEMIKQIKMESELMEDEVEFERSLEEEEIEERTDEANRFGNR